MKATSFPIYHLSFTVPKYSSFAISDPNLDKFITVADNAVLRISHTQENDPIQLWMYTNTKQLMNIKTLQCMDAQKHSNIGVRPCQITNNTSQQWLCNRTFDGVYQMVRDKEEYLRTDGIRFYIAYYDSYMRFQWMSLYGSTLMSICDRPDIYQGECMINQLICKR